MYTVEKPYANNKLYKCEVCEKYFNLKYNFNRHLRIHTGEKSYQCSICNKTYNDRSGLTKHERFHTGEKLFKCSYCEKLFADKYKWTNHERVHSGISSSINGKMYKCEVCQKCFSGKHNYTRHVRIHTGEKPYVCIFCGKAFADKSHHTKHVRFHTGENLYKCRYCEKRFANKNKLTLHEPTHTEKCDAANDSFSHKNDCTTLIESENRKYTIATALDYEVDMNHDHMDSKIERICADVNSESSVSDCCKVENAEEIEIIVKCERFDNGNYEFGARSESTYASIKSEVNCDYGEVENVEKKCESFDTINDQTESRILTVCTAIKIEKSECNYCD